MNDARQALETHSFSDTYLVPESPDSNSSISSGSDEFHLSYASSPSNCDEPSFLSAYHSPYASSVPTPAGAVTVTASSLASSDPMSDLAMMNLAEFAAVAAASPAITVQGRSVPGVALPLSGPALPLSASLGVTMGMVAAGLPVAAPAPAAALAMALPMPMPLPIGIGTCSPSPVSLASMGSGSACMSPSDPPTPSSCGPIFSSLKLSAKVEVPSPMSTPLSGSLPDPSDELPPSGVDSDTIRELLKEQGVKKLRLARKAELARVSRKRKKSRLCELEVEVAELKEELERECKLRKAAQDSLIVAQQHARLAQASAPVVPEVMDLSHAQAQAQPRPQIQLANNAAGGEVALAEEVKLLHEAIRCSLSALSVSGVSTFHEQVRLVSELVNTLKKHQGNALAQTKHLQKSLTAPLPLRFLEWALSQKDHFYEDNSGLWNSLFVREVGLVPEQLSALMSLRPAVQMQRSSALDVQTAFAKLTTSLHAHASQGVGSVDKFVSLLTPEQLCKFFTWVDTYGSVCIQINI